MARPGQAVARFRRRNRGYIKSEHHPERPNQYFHTIRAVLASLAGVPYEPILHCMFGAVGKADRPPSIVA